MSRKTAAGRHLHWKWLGLTVGLWLALATVERLAASAQTRPALVQQGYTLLDRGWVNDAITRFREAIRQFPQSLEAKLGLAIAYQRAGQDENAWNAYQQVLAQDPNNRPALTAIGTLGSYRPQWQPQGIAALTTLLELNPNDSAARAQRALLYGYQGAFTAALADYQPLLAANPSAEVLLGAAQIYTYSGDYPTGLSLFDRYRATGATIPDGAISAYALTLQKTGSPDRAVQVLNERLRSLRTLDNTAIQIRSALAIAYAADQQLEPALQVLEPLRGTEAGTLPLARALSAIGRDTRNADLSDSAVALYRQVQQRTADPSPGLLTEIADVFSEAPAAWEEALALYEQLVQQLPDNTSLQIKRLALQQQLGQLPPAELRSQLQALLEPLPSQPVERRSLALALLRVDAPDPALLPVYQSLLTDTDEPFFNYRIAQIYLRQGDLAAARTALATYAETPEGKEEPASELLLAEIERREGNLEASAQRYQALVDRNLGDQVGRDALRGLAGIRLAQGRAADALPLYDQLVANYPQAEISRLAQAGVAYQLQRLPEAEATAVLDQWLSADAASEPPPELFILVGALPAAPARQALYDQLLAIDPDNIAINRRWIQLRAQQNPDQATARVNQLIDRHPDDPGVYFLQGELAQQLNNLSLASQAYETLLAKDPQNPDALAALGGVRFQQKRYQDARRLYEQVLTLKPDDRATRQILVDLSIAQDQPISALQQLRDLQPPPDAALSDRIRQQQAEILRRRGFQPYWERY